MTGSSAAAPWPIAMPSQDEYVDSLWERSVEFLAPAFPDATPDQIRLITDAARWFVHYIVTFDHLIDHDEDTDPGASARLPAFGTEAILTYGTAVGHGPPFWADFKNIVGAFVRETENELRWKRDGSIPSVDEALAWGTARGGLAKITAAALFHADGGQRVGERASADELFDCFAVITQVMDDIVDWRDDWERRAPSMLLAFAFEGFAGRPFACADPAPFVYGVGMPAALSVADDRLQRGLAAASSLGTPRWVDALERLAAKLRGLQRELVSGIAVRAARAPQDLESSRAALESMPAGPLRRGLLLLHDDIADRSIGLKHLMSVERDSSSPDVYVADVHLRAMAANTMVELAGDGCEEWSLLESEAEYLWGVRSQRPVGGWSYVPDLDDMPCDIDTSAEVARFLCSMGHSGELESILERIVSVVETSIGRGGGVWLEEGPGGVTAGGRRRDDGAAFGNLLLLLETHFPGRFENIAVRLTDHLLALQGHRGGWRSGWYATPYYPTYLAVAGLARRRAGGDDRPAIGQALDRAVGYVSFRPHPARPLVLDAALRGATALVCDRIDGVTDDLAVALTALETGQVGDDALLNADGTVQGGARAFEGARLGSSSITTIWCLRCHRSPGRLSTSVPRSNDSRLGRDRRDEDSRDH